MKKICSIYLLFIMFFSCAPVLKQDLLRQGNFVAHLSGIKENPVNNKGRLFILGGIIVKTTITKDGSLVEAIFVPVTSRGYLKSYRTENGRFLALFKNREILDPLIFQEKREITLAGEFIGIRKGTIDETEYSYPFFEIKEVYLWPEPVERNDYFYRSPHFYPPPYYRHRHYDPWYPWHYY